MNKKIQSSIKICSYISFGILILSVIPLIILGFYSHPLGDDYHYGILAKRALESGNLFSAISAAAQGTKEQYYAWQGTYSAMFLMHLPPQIFGDVFYKLYPAVLITALGGSIFYLLKPIICSYLASGKHIWVLLSSITVFLCLEQVPLMGETFYWYNGSMYYTGFLAATFFFFGILLRFLIDEKSHRIFYLSLLGLFLAGGNYATLLPTMIILSTTIIFSFITKKNSKSKLGVIIPSVLILAGFIISAKAPGNLARKEEVYGTTPIKAVLKSLLQGLSYLKGWSNVWLFLALILLTPLFIYMISNISFKFKYPAIVVCYCFGIFSSASCPTFYAQNNGGAARVFDISWYLMVLLILGSYFYLLGWFVKRFENKSILVPEITIVVLFIALALARPISETHITLNSVQAVEILSSGDAKYYDNQYKERLPLLESSEFSSLVFKAYDVPESVRYILYLGDIGTDPSEFGNVNLATYYQKESIRIE